MTDRAADAANSYHNLYSRNVHSLQLAQTINLAPIQLMPNVKANWQRESQDYRRGALDTAAVRRSFFFDPSLSATWKLSNTVGLELNYSFTTRQPDIMQTIGYRDLTDPLFITEGNPGLRNTHTHAVSLTYNMVLARSQTSLSTTVGYNRSDRETTTALSYDPATTVYVSRPENVRGSHSWSFRVNLDQALGDYFRLQSNFRLNASKSYGYLTSIVTTPLPHREGAGVGQQCVGSLTSQENITLSLDYNWLKATVFTEISAERLRYSASPGLNTTHWNNDYGLRAEASYGDFVFYTTLTEHTSRGYTFGSMNRNILVWDAAVGWRILKNKARLGLEFDDILNNEDGRRSQQTAYQQTTSWHDFRHHYVGIRFTYHLDAKEKLVK
jgi:outer membrane receptor protein involved in Fe transport